MPRVAWRIRRPAAERPLQLPHAKWADPRASPPPSHLPLLTRTQSTEHAVLATLKRAPSELSAYQRKTFKIDDHLGIAISGLTADGRILCRYMRNECLNHR